VAVAVILEFAGATLEDYDRVLAALGFAGAGRGEPGILFHWVAALPDGGIRVVDVWRDRDLAEAFVRDRLVGATQAFGATGPPEIQVLEIHNFMREG
jgi:hypothetical protein